MQIDFSTWTKRSLTVDNLRLDIDNPRFSYFSNKKMNQTEIVKYLIDRFDVYELAKSIAKDGYLINEEPIVCKEGESYVVLEGNRRVAACKILLNPSKYLSAQKAQIIINYNYKLEKIFANIAPSRRSADILIYRRHTTTSIKRWETISQDAHIHNLFSIERLSISNISNLLGEDATSVRKSLRRYNAHQYAMTLFEDEPGLKEDVCSDRFSITNIERFYDYEEGRNFLGISFDENGVILKNMNEEEIKKRFKYIVCEVLNDNLNSRVFNTTTDKNEYIDNLYSQNIFDFSSKTFEAVPIQNEISQESETSESPEIPEVPKKQPSAKKTYKLFQDKNWNVGIGKIDDIFSSIKKLNYSKDIDLVCIAFRCYLEMIIYEFLKKKGCLDNVPDSDRQKINKENEKKYSKIKQYLIDNFSLSESEINEDFRYELNLGEKQIKTSSLSLRQMLQYIATNPDLFKDNKQRSALNSMLDKTNDFIDLHSFNMMVHNHYYFITSEQLEATVNNLLPLLDNINTTIKND